MGASVEARFIVRTQGDSIPLARLYADGSVSGNRGHRTLVCTLVASRATCTRNEPKVVLSIQSSATGRGMPFVPVEFQRLSPRSDFGRWRDAKLDGNSRVFVAIYWCGTGLRLNQLQRRGIQ